MTLAPTLITRTTAMLSAHLHNDCVLRRAWDRRQAQRRGTSGTRFAGYGTASETSFLPIANRLRVDILYSLPDQPASMWWEIHRKLRRRLKVLRVGTDLAPCSGLSLASGRKGARSVRNSYRNASLMEIVMLLWDEFDDWLGASAHLLRTHSICHDLPFPAVKPELTVCRNQCLRSIRSAISAFNATAMRFD
jgi:hypothetical protein